MRIPATTSAFLGRLLGGTLAILFLLLAATPTSAQDRFVPASRQANTVGVITIQGPIDDMTLKTIERRLDDAAKDGCGAIVIELDTPGGALPPTLAICHLLKTRGPANKVAWVRPQAFSAGAIIALACREIVAAPESVVGDAAPIAIGPAGNLQPLPAEERAKLEAPVLSEVTDSALRNHHDVRLARAFVHMGDELWLLERDDGVRLFANAEECRIALGRDPPRSSERFVPEPSARGPLLDLGTNEPDDDTDREAFVREPRIDSSEAGRWKLLGQVDTADELLTLRGTEAVRYGLATQSIDTDGELAAYFGATSIRRYDESWSEGLVRFLVSWPVRGVLIVIMILSLFAEMVTQGMGIFGLVSFAAFILLVGAPVLAGLAQWWEILLIVVGIGLIIVELLLTPGLGIAGAVGAVCLLVGLVFSFVGGDLSSPQSHADLLAALFAVLGSFAIAGIGIALLAKHLPSVPFFKRLVLDANVGEGATTMALGPSDPGVPIGTTGTAMTDLRPSGRIVCGDRMLDARSNGAWIARGTAVRIVDRDGLSAIVEEIA